MFILQGGSWPNIQLLLAEPPGVNILNYVHKKNKLIIIIIIILRPYTKIYNKFKQRKRGKRKQNWVLLFLVSNLHVTEIVGFRLFTIYETL